MKSLKKILTLLMVAVLAATMATTAFAAQEAPMETVDPIVVASGETALIVVNTEGSGQVAVSDYDSEPEFDDDSPIQSTFINADIGTTIRIGAKAEEGWRFLYWINADTNEFFSMSATVPVDVTGDLNLKAIFADASLVTISANTEGNGQVAVSEDGSDPVFNDEQPKQSVAVSAAVGDTVILGAKADEGWKFIGWKNADTDEMYSTDETVYIEVTGALRLIAVFVEDDGSERLPSGAWTFSDQAYYTISDDKKAVFESAIANTYNGTSTFEAVQTLASESVPGANYAFLCKETPAGSEEPTNWSVLTVYVDWDGNATLTHVEKIDPLNLKTLDEVPPEEPGCWTVLRTDKGLTLSHAVTDALMLRGVNYVPAAIIATQLVAGTNYRILAYGTQVTAEPRTDLYVVDVYEGLDGTAEVTNISVFDIDSYTVTEIVEPVSEPIRAEHTSITCGRNSDVIINTTSKSDTVVIRIDGGTAATNETEGLTLENGTVTISKELANKILKDGENKLNLVFSDGVLEVVVYVTDDEPIRAEHTSITCGRNSDVIINTTSKSDTVVIRIGGGTAATNETEGLTFENGTVTISKELANKILKDGENKLNLVFSDGVLEVVVYVTDDEPIRAEHTSITCGRNSDIVINTTSKSDTVVVRIDGGTAATNETEGLTLENGTVKISKELANKILKDGENKLNLVFSDGTLEIVVYVTGESSTITPDIDVPKTGDAASAIAVSAVLLSSLTAALFLAMKRRKGEQE